MVPEVCIMNPLPLTELTVRVPEPVAIADTAGVSKKGVEKFMVHELTLPDEENPSPVTYVPEVPVTPPLTIDNALAAFVFDTTIF